VTNLSIAGLLHDIGKIGVPDAVLNKLDTLTDDEWLYIDRHPVLGADIVRHLSGLREVVKTILHHHEKFDGTGYPDCMAGEEIPFKARIVCVVDSYHAMISDRPYRAGLSRTEALTELNRCRETHFDPRIVDKFIELIEKEGVAGGSQGTAGSDWDSVSA
jgi:polar amino acid transport system substrate-binding protein